MKGNVKQPSKMSICGAEGHLWGSQWMINLIVFPNEREKKKNSIWENQEFPNLRKTINTQTKGKNKKEETKLNKSQI